MMGLWMILFCIVNMGADQEGIKAENRTSVLVLLLLQMFRKFRIGYVNSFQPNTDTLHAQLPWPNASQSKPPAFTLRLSRFAPGLSIASPWSWRSVPLFDKKRVIHLGCCKQTRKWFCSFRSNTNRPIVKSFAFKLDAQFCLIIRVKQT